jgi:hypothetical protein
VFPLEEAVNGLTWMNENEEAEEEGEGGGEEGVDTDGEREGDEESVSVGTAGEATPARREEGWLA